jgi:hypothetical protein
MLGVWLVCIAIMGYLVRAVKPVMRLLFAASGLALLIPAGAFEGALYTDIAGGAVGIGLFLWEYVSGRNRGPTPTTATKAVHEDRG